MKKPEKKSVPKKTTAAPKKAAAPKKTTAKRGPIGKWIIRTGDSGAYHFELRASNGEIMLVSGEYSTVAGAKNGISTYKKNIEAGNFAVVKTKAGDYIFRLLNAQKRLLCVSSNYDTQINCENAVESTKRWGASDVIEVAED